MNPLNFYKNPNDLDYEKDIDPIGRDLIRQINSTPYLRTTMYCSGHFPDEQEYPWMEGQMELCLVALDVYTSHVKLNETVRVLRDTFGFSNVHGGPLYLYKDPNDRKEYYLSNLIINYKTKENRLKTIDILQRILI